MAKPQINFEKPIKYFSNKKFHKAKSIIFSAFLFSIFIYLILFHLSPSTLFNDTKFWFFLTNALILIVAADSGAFSSSKQQHDFYDEYLMNSRARHAASSVVPSPENSTKDGQQKISIIVHSSETLPERKLEAHSQTLEDKKPKQDSKGGIDIKATCVEKKNEARYYRSQSEKAISVDVGKKNKKILQRSETEKHKPKSEENELSAMSDEELNRRVEEFIERFNREIRLQETTILGEKLEKEVE